MVMTNKMKWTVFGVISGCWLLGTFGFAFIGVPKNSDQTFQIFNFTFLSIGAYGVVTATYFSAFNILESSQNNQEKIRSDRIENSFRFIERWDEPSLKEARDFTREISENINKISSAELLNRISTEKGLKKSVITAFNFWEGIWISHEHNRISDKLLKDAFAKVYTNMYDNFKPWIVDTRDDPKMRENLKKLYDLWSN